MGTRNLTMVIHDSKTKIAQYGQWDGYPSCTGVIIFNFLDKILDNKELMDKFVDKISNNVRFVDKKKGDEIEEFLKSIGSVDGWMTGDQALLYNEKYPYLSRDHGARILNKILDSNDDEIYIHDDEKFAGESLFCEWAWVIDLDKMILEVYKGFNKKPVPDNSRFKKYENPNEEYMSVKLKKTYKLNRFPETVEDFLKNLKD